MKCTIEDTTISQNPYDRMHRWQRKEYRDIWYWLVRASVGEVAKAQSPKKVHIVRVAKRLLDDQNIPAATKPLVDALVEYGWLFDDSRKWARITWDQRKCEADEQPHTEITVEDWKGD